MSYSNESDHQRDRRRGVAGVAFAAAGAGPVLSLSSPGGTVALAVLALCGLILWRRAGTLPADLAGAGRGLLVLYLGLVAIDVLNGGGLENLTSTAVNYLPLVLPVPAALALCSVQAGPALLERGAQAAILVATVAAGAQWIAAGNFSPGDYGGVIGLNLAQILFGLVVTVWGSFLLIRGLQAGRRGRVSLALAMLALVPAYMTLSKLIWGLIVLSYGLTLVIWAVQGRRWGMLAALCGGAVAGMAGLWLLSGSVRLETAQLMAELGLIRGDRLSATESLSSRAELWRGGIAAGLERPLMGHGITERTAATFRALGPDSPAIGHGHLHNDYVTHFVAFGLPGLVFLALVFLKIARLATAARDLSMRHFGRLVITVLAIYMGFEVVFNMDPASGLLGLILAWLMADGRDRPAHV